MQGQPHEKYMSEIEAHAEVIVEICKNYGEDIGTSLTDSPSEDLERIAKADAEKGMLLGVMRYMLDCFMDGGK